MHMVDLVRDGRIGASPLPVRDGRIGASPLPVWLKGAYALARRGPRGFDDSAVLGERLRLWRALPAPVTGRLGPRLCRYLADY